ncbi:MAG: 3-phosphoshikimate 1-carboxyvinyltransferase [Treponema sp.]
MDVKVFGSSLKDLNSSSKKFPICWAPPSKSHSIRFLVLAALAKGESIISNILDSEDILSCYQCLIALGVSFNKLEKKQSSISVCPPKEGLKNYAKKQKEITLNVGNSGTLLYVLSMLVASLPANFYIIGDASIKKRPLEPIIAALKELGVSYDIPSTQDGIINIKGIEVEKGMKLKLEGKFSQVITGLLLTSPFFHKQTSIKLEKAGEAPYLEMTLKHLKKQNIRVEYSKDLKSYCCEGGQSINGFQAMVPSDWSSTSFLALASIASFSPIAIKSLSLKDKQADSKLLSYLKALGVPIRFKNGTLKIKYTSPIMEGRIFDIANSPDILPSLSCIASLANGKTILKGIDICRYKECNRVEAMVRELSKLGVNIIEEKDSLTIEGVEKIKSGLRLCTYKDHRIALALIALCLSLEKDEYCIIEDVECCAVSYPNFIDVLKSLGANIVIS